MYKTAIIGLGQIGYKLDNDSFRDLIWSHSKAYTKHNNTKLISVCDLDKENHDDFNKFYPNITFYDDYLKMVKNIDLDIISICTPTHTHLDIVSKITNTKPPKAIFIEKPMGQNLKEAIEISKLCEKNNIILAVNYMRRWDNKYKLIKNIIAKKELGYLQTISAYGCTALLTSTSHLIDLFFLFGGNIEWIVGDLQSNYIRKVENIEDPGGVALIKFKNGVVGFLKGISKNDKNFMFEIDIMFENGRITIKEPWIDNDLAEINIWKFSPRNNDEIDYFNTLNRIKKYETFPQKERMIEAVSNIIECIENGNTPQSNGLNASLVHLIIEKLKYSYKNNNCKVVINE